ncbi:hypothetical protein [Candidatus Tisiphia endosymbiont of Beris chalybata]|uniref:hypothetical protein n=1 Tax=Candidatus Tisiphia endosymbiont of Beris chalybata TaxID=3066262 RepID=UPI00312C724A
MLQNIMKSDEQTLEELEAQYQKVTDVLQDFIDNEDECRMVQYRERSDLKSKGLPLHFAKHSGNSQQMYYGYLALLNAANILIDTHPNNTTPRTAQEKALRAQTFSHAAITLKYMAELAYDFQPKTNNEKFEDGAVQARIENTKETVNNIYKKEGRVYLPTSLLKKKKRRHRLVTKLSQENNNYYITKFNAGGRENITDAIKSIAGFLQFTDDGMPIIYDTVKYRVEVDDIPEFINFIIANNYTNKISCSQKTVSELKKKEQQLSQRLNNIIHKEEGSNQRIGNCSTRSIRIALRNMLLPSDFRQVFDIITTINYEEILSALKSYQQELDQKLGTAQDHPSTPHIFPPNLSTQENRIDYLIQAINQQVNHLLKFPLDTNHLNKIEQDNYLYLRLTRCYDNKPAIYHLLAQNIAKDLVRRKIIIKDEPTGNPFYPLDSQGKPLLQNQLLPWIGCPHEGNTLERLDMICQYCAYICTNTDSAAESPLTAELNTKVEYIIKKALQTKYHNLLAGDNMVITTSLANNAIKYVTAILKQAKKEGHVVFVEQQHVPDKLAIVDPKYIGDNKEKFVQEIASSLPDPAPSYVFYLERLRKTIATVNPIISGIKEAVSTAKDASSAIKNVMITGESAIATAEAAKLNYLLSKIKLPKKKIQVTPDPKARDIMLAQHIERKQILLAELRNEMGHKVYEKSLATDHERSITAEKEEEQIRKETQKPTVAPIA